VDWYYVENGKPMGPIAEDQLVQLIQKGNVSLDTLVWHDGMAEWKSCREAGPSAAVAAMPGALGDAGPGHKFCVQCGNNFLEDDMVKFENFWVCVNCKPVFLQKLKEGVKLPTTMVYGGFWIRLGAWIIDYIVLQIINYMLILPLIYLAGFKNSEVFGMVWFFQIFIAWLMPVAFKTFFVGKFGATPGKMACRLRIVTPDGGRVGYLRALARSFAEWISAMIVFIGYLMAAWDDEKKTLHDRICNTRVMRTT